MPRDQLFISYSHKGKRWRDELETQLKPHLRAGPITSWSDQQIAPGSQWLKDIESALANSKIAVLLVSPDFLASDFVHERELGPLLKKAEQGGAKILWAPVRGSAYKQTPLKNYQAVFDPSKPLAGISKAKRDQAWVEICEKIQKAVDCTYEAAKPALEWDKHLRHRYRSEGSIIYTQAVQLSVKNISGRAVRLEHAHLMSVITGGSAEMTAGTPEGWVPPSQASPIPADCTVTLQAEFHPPSGLPAQEFANLWGKMVLSVAYDGATHEVAVGEDTIQALYVNFRPNPLKPMVMRATSELDSTIISPIPERTKEQIVSELASKNAMLDAALGEAFSEGGISDPMVAATIEAIRADKTINDDKSKQDLSIFWLHLTKKARGWRRYGVATAALEFIDKLEFGHSAIEFCLSENNLTDEQKRQLGIKMANVTSRKAVIWCHSQLTRYIRDDVCYGDFLSRHASLICEAHYGEMAAYVLYPYRPPNRFMIFAILAVARTTGNPQPFRMRLCEWIKEGWFDGPLSHHGDEYVPAETLYTCFNDVLDERIEPLMPAVEYAIAHVSHLLKSKEYYRRGLYHLISMLSAEYRDAERVRMELCFFYDVPKKEDRLLCANLAKAFCLFVDSRRNPGDDTLAKRFAGIWSRIMNLDVTGFWS